MLSTALRRGASPCASASVGDWAGTVCCRALSDSRLQGRGTRIRRFRPCEAAVNRSEEACEQCNQYSGSTACSWQFPYRCRQAVQTATPLRRAECSPSTWRCATITRGLVFRTTYGSVSHHEWQQAVTSIDHIARPLTFKWSDVHDTEWSTINPCHGHGKNTSDAENGETNSCTRKEKS